MADQEKLLAIMYFARKTEFHILESRKTEFHILECEALAKALDASSKMTFDIVGPKGRMTCRWLDAHYGIFERTDQPKSAAFHTKQFQFVDDIHCENLGDFS